MNPQQSQAQMNGDQSAAALAFATQLQEQIMPQETVEAPMESETGSGQEMGMESQESTPIDNEALKNQIKDELVVDVKNDMKAIIREELKKLLDEDETTETS